MEEIKAGDLVVHKIFKDGNDTWRYYSGAPEISHIPMVVLEVDNDKAFCQYYCYFTYKFVELWFYKIALRQI